MIYLCIFFTLAFLAQSIRASVYKENATRWKEEADRAWAYYKKAHEDNRWKGKFPGDKHEFGHDYE